MVAGAEHSRRSFLTLAGLLASGSLVACGSNTGRGDAAGGGGTLRHWYHAYGEEGVQDAVTRYAEAYPGAEVEVQWNPGDYDSKIVTALQNSPVPDVFEAQVKVEWVRQQQVVPLDDVLGAERGDFVQTLLAAQTVDGAVYGIPQAIDTQVLFYRKSMLAAAGVAPPRTLDELIDAAAALNTGGVRGLFAGNDGGVSTFTGPLLWSAGLDFLSADSRTVGFDDPRAATAFAKLRDLNDGGGLLLGAPSDWSDPGAFIDGLVAMQWTGLWNLPKIREAVGEDFGVLPFPALDGAGTVSVPVGAYSAMVNTKSADVEAAKAYVRWLWVERAEYQSEFATGFGVHLPARTSLSGAGAGPALSSGVGAEVVRFVADSGRILRPPAWTARANTALSDAVSRIAREGADPVAETRKALDVAGEELTRLYG